MQSYMYHILDIFACIDTVAKHSFLCTEFAWIYVLHSFLHEFKLLHLCICIGHLLEEMHVFRMYFSKIIFLIMVWYGNLKLYSDPDAHSKEM